MRDIFLSKIETKIDDIRKLSHENLISQLMNRLTDIKKYFAK